MLARMLARARRSTGCTRKCIPRLPISQLPPHPHHLAHPPHAIPHTLISHPSFWVLQVTMRAAPRWFVWFSPGRQHPWGAHSVAGKRNPRPRAMIAIPQQKQIGSSFRSVDCPSTLRHRTSLRGEEVPSAPTARSVHPTVFASGCFSRPFPSPKTRLAPPQPSPK